jgi:hypothetical protein
VAQRYAQSQVCPIDKKDDCQTTKDWSKPLFWVSFGINVIGSFYAFILPRLLE